MFRKYAALQWLWFWFASGIVYYILSGVLPKYQSVGLEASILGNFFWAGLIVILITWGVSSVVRYLKNLKGRRGSMEHLKQAGNS